MPETADAKRAVSDTYGYLTTHGRLTGRPHRVELWYAADGETLYLLSGGGRSSDWVQNLVADPDVVIEFLGAARAGQARVVENDEEAERARTLVVAKYAPRSSGDLTGWRNSSVPIAIDLTAHSA